MTGKRPLPGRTPYAAAKTGLIGLVRTLAWDAGPYGVRVNLVSPGPVAGERLDGVLRAQGPGAAAAFRAASPLARFATAGRRRRRGALPLLGRRRRRSPARTSTCRRGR